MNVSGWKRLINLMAFAAFVAWAYWQLNDPDTLIWIVLYLLAAVACAFFFVGRLPLWFALAVGAVALLIGLERAYGVIAEEQYFFDEEGREMMGSLLVAAYMGVLGCWVRCRCRHQFISALIRRERN